MVVRVVPRRSPDLRCALCHDVEGPVRACPGCGTVTHADCRAEADLCPTLGCGRRRLIVMSRRRSPLARVVHDGWALLCYLLMAPWLIFAALLVLVLLAAPLRKYPAPAPYRPELIDSEITARIPGG